MQTSSFIKLVSSLCVAAASSMAALPAAAQESAPGPSPAPALSAPTEQADVPRPATSPAGRAVAFGFDNGLFGGAYEQGVRVRVPLAQHFALSVRGMSVLGDLGGDMTWHVGGRVEMIGHTPVYLNLVRLYGGGGPQVTTRLEGGSGDKNHIGGGGQFGFEFFLNPKFSFFAEIGGHAADEGIGGGTALAGMMLYPFSGP